LQNGFDTVVKEVESELAEGLHELAHGLHIALQEEPSSVALQLLANWLCPEELGSSRDEAVATPLPV
jgi:hypothetical protein